jgi:hypothetical protein
MPHTVDSNGNALGEDKAISADEGRNLVEGVGLEELLSGLGGIGLDLLELEAVGLRDSADGRGAGVALNRRVRSAKGGAQTIERRGFNDLRLREGSATYRVGVELAERHLCL